MFIFVLLIVGLAAGSFVNALVWRVHEQEKSKKNRKDPNLSILFGRSMCPNCMHQLKAADLIPLVSWVLLRGKCRYCSRTISVQYPLVELSMAALFVISGMFWPYTLESITSFFQIICWLIMLTIMVALIVYDLRWMLLPDKIVAALGLMSILYILPSLFATEDPFNFVAGLLLSIAIAGGLFYVLYQVSEGKWIGGGDVKLGFVLGIILYTPTKSILMLFLASLLGTIVSLPLMYADRLKKTSIIPFGPFLLAATYIVTLFGENILDWYQTAILLQ